MDDIGVYRMLKRLYGCDSALESSVGGGNGKRSYKKSRLGSVGKKQVVYRIIHHKSLLKLPALVTEAEKESICSDELDGIIADLKARGLIYEPEPGFVGCVGD
jgi:hypothetical protein